MDLERLRALIDLVATSAITELEIEEAGQRLRISRGRLPTAATPPAAPPPSATLPRSSAASSGHLVVAPMYGIFHAAPAPGERPFVEIGQEIVVGQTLCILEAMKVFNIVHAEAAGRIEEILIGSGTEVEAGQPLFRLACLP